MPDKQLFLNIKNFSITDYKDDKRFLQLEIWGCCEGETRNSDSFTLEAMQDALPTLYNSPILCYIDKRKNDAKGHEMRLIGVDENGNPIYNFDNGERIVGIVNESSNVRIEEKDGVNWTVYTALIFVDYNYELRQILKRDKIKSVSIEIKVLDSEMINEIEQINKFIYKGTTILGKAVRPGIAGAMLKLLSYNEENFGQFKDAVCFALNEPPLNKFTIPSPIKEIIQKQMDNIKNYPMNTTEQISTLITAKDLLANEDISLEQGELILQQIHEHENDFEDLNKQILCLLLGGDLMKEFIYSIGGIDKNFISEDDIGTGNAIKIDLSKKVASNDAWGFISKTDLRNNILKASNYKVLVNSCYLLIDDDWENSPSSSLHYPVCQIKNNILVYNINGVQSARSFLEKNKDAPYYTSVTTKLNKIYKKLGLDHDKNHIKYSEKEARYMVEKFKELFAQENKYKFVNFNDNTVLVYSIEKSNFEALPYSVDNENIIMDADNLKTVSFNCKYATDEDGEDVEMECKEMSEVFSSVYSDLGKITEEKDNLNKQFEAEVEKSKQLEVENKEFAEAKVKLEEEKQFVEAEKEKALSEKVEFETKFSESEKKFTELKTENEKIMSEINEFKEQKFTEIIKQCSFEYKMSDEDVQIWTEKSKTFEKIEDFEKELVFTFHKTRVNSEHFKMGGFDNKSKNKSQSKSAIERLKTKNN